MPTLPARTNPRTKSTSHERRKRGGVISLGRTAPANFVTLYGLAPAERIALVKRGIPAGEVVIIAKTIGRPKERLMKLLGFPRATIDRKSRSNLPLSVEQGERLVGFAKLVGQVQVMVEQSGNPVGFDAAKWLGEWLERPLPALGGHCPAVYMDTNEGQQLVSGLLGQMQSGAYA